MIRQWVRPLIAGVVLTICLLATALAVDCHVRKPEREQCQDSDDRALTTLVGMLGTLLALRVPPDDDEQPPG